MSLKCCLFQNVVNGVVQHEVTSVCFPLACALELRHVFEWQRFAPSVAVLSRPVGALSFVIRSPVEEYLGFQLEAVLNKAAINICVQCEF